MTDSQRIELLSGLTVRDLINLTELISIAHVSAEQRGKRTVMLTAQKYGDMFSAALNKKNFESPYGEYTEFTFI